MVVVKAAGISSDSPLGAWLSGRGEILELTEKSHDAVLRPRQPGELTHSERAGLACRISTVPDIHTEQRGNPGPAS